MAGDQNNVGMGFGDTCGNGSNTDLRDQLHVHTGPRVRVLQIVDQLREVLDRVGGEISPTPGVECRVLAIHG